VQLVCRKAGNRSPGFSNFRQVVAQGTSIIWLKDCSVFVFRRYSIKHSTVYRVMSKEYLRCMKSEYIFSNPQGSILRVDAQARCFYFFRDPWGRESSSIPDETFLFSEELMSNSEFVKILSQLNTQEKEEVLAILQDSR
jgi:hypothetical protein